MTLDDMIKRLEKIKSKHGNLPVICVRDEGGYYFHDSFEHVVDAQVIDPKDHGEISNKSLVIARFKD